jgi:hypothetical protein
MSNRETKELIASARDHAMAFVTADPVLQDVDPNEVRFALSGILTREVKNGQRDKTALANLAIRTLRHREEVRLSTASLYRKHGRQLSR